MPVLPPLSLGFRVFDRLGADGAGVELCGFLWSESGASPVEAATRSCLWNFSDACFVAICSKSAISVCCAGLAEKRSSRHRGLTGRQAEHLFRACSNLRPEWEPTYGGNTTASV